MMMNSTLKKLSKPRPGTVITGKWHKNSYRVLRELGSGANGIVYLAQAGGAKVALKISGGTSVASEVNVLKSFAKVWGSISGPSLIDVDDWVRPEGATPFYVMEYIEGPNLLDFIRKNGRAWAEVLILQLLKDLHVLHEHGWVFGDLKPENLIVTGSPPRIRCIDVGGTTVKGRAIKEFTQSYDRGYWELGTRRAEPSYDLFSAAMIMIHIHYGKALVKKEGGIKQLKEIMKEKPELVKFSPVLLKALQGWYHSAEEMRLDMLKTINGMAGITAKPAVHPGNAPMSRREYRKKKRKFEWLETILIVKIVSMIYILYLFGQ